MYEELVKRLRLAKAVLCKNKDLIALLSDAADAIEELSRDVDITNAANTALYGALPKWIPVTERLPENGEIVLIDWWNIHCAKRNNLSVMKFYKGKPADEVNPYKGIRFCDQWGNNKVPYAWADPHGPLQLFGQDVTHWMPLPSVHEPPKEET